MCEEGKRAASRGVVSFQGGSVRLLCTMGGGKATRGGGGVPVDSGWAWMVLVGKSYPNSVLYLFLASASIHIAPQANIRGQYVEGQGTVQPLPWYIVPVYSVYWRRTTCLQ